MKLETTPIDRTVLNNLLSLFNGDKAFLDQVIETYLADGLRLIASIEQAVATGTPEELQRAAHSLKSTSANLGAMTLSNLSRELEGLGKSGALTDVAPIVADTKAEFQQVKAALETIRAEGM